MLNFQSWKETCVRAYCIVLTVSCMLNTKRLTLTPGRVHYSSLRLYGHVKSCIPYYGISCVTP
jgi:hypothetical protein